MLGIIAPQDYLASQMLAFDTILAVDIFGHVQHPARSECKLDFPNRLGTERLKKT